MDYTDTFDADVGAWDGGVVAEGVLSVTDGVATLPLAGAASFSGTIRLRLAGETGIVALSAGTGAWRASYVDGGGVAVGGDFVPFPPGHYRWVPDDDPVIQPDGATWDGGSTLHCEAVYDEATATYFLFWTGEMTPGYGYRQIGLATSPDAITWNEYAGNPVLTIDYDLTSVDGVHVHMPTVERDDAGGWHMFYSCYQNDVGNRICHATSPDGFTWTPEGVALDLGDAGAFDDGSLRMPDVLRTDDGAWHLLYNGTRPEEHYGPTGYATSPDGWTWTRQGAISADKSFLQGGGMLATPWGITQWYNCDDLFCEATAPADDLSDWTDRGLVLEKGWQPWNDGYVQAPSALTIGTTHHMWFNGYTYTEGLERIGHARTVPVGGGWIDLDVAWDGATLTVTQEGFARSTPATGVEGITVAAEGTAEIDAVAITWEVASGDTGGDTAAEDTAAEDTAEIGDTAAEDTAEAAAQGQGGGCGGCGGGGQAVLLAPLLLRRRRSTEGR